SLALDVLAGVADALALVGLGLAPRPDVGGHLADGLLVDAGHDDAVGGRHLEGDAVGGLDVDRVAEAQGQLQGVGALGRRPVADAHDLELLAEALGDADHHVVDQRADEAVHGPGLALVVGALDHQLVAVLADGDATGDVALQRPLGAAHGDVPVLDRHLDAAGHGDGGLTDARHGGCPPVAEDLAAPPAPARLSVGQQPLAGRDARDAQAPEHAGDLVGLRVDAQAGLGHALEARDGARAVGAVLHADAQGLAGLADVLLHVVPLDVPLGREDARQGLLQLARGHAHLVVHRHVGVADPGEHVGDGVGHGHGASTPFTSSPWSRRAARLRARARAGRCGTARTCGTRRAVGRNGGTGCRPGP